LKKIIEKKGKIKEKVWSYLKNKIKKTTKIKIDVFIKVRTFRLYIKDNKKKIKRKKKNKFAPFVPYILFSSISFIKPQVQLLSRPSFLT